MNPGSRNRPVLCTTAVTEPLNSLLDMSIKFYDINTSNICSLAMTEIPAQIKLPAQTQTQTLAQTKMQTEITAQTQTQKQAQTQTQL